MSITRDRCSAILPQSIRRAALWVLPVFTAGACIGQGPGSALDSNAVETGEQSGALTVSLVAATANSGPTVKTPGGKFPAATYMGETTSGVAAFRGVRFAKAPTGELRWAAPVPPDATDATSATSATDSAGGMGMSDTASPAAVDARKFGSACPQVASPFGEASTDEDCLFLNVYVPEQTARRGDLPVMVFYYGGAFVSGSSSLYNPSQLVTEGNVIVVTVNYRLGVLGYMASPELSRTSSDGVSGNYGFLDQQLALQWVRQNIGAFGGNPRDVTIFGESAGGFSVCAMLAVPSVRGLFDRAITESGPCAFPLPELAASEKVGTTFTRDANCQAPTDDKTIECLRGLSTQQVLDHQPSSSALLSSPTGLTAFFPNVDSKVIPQQPLTAFTLGQFNRVPVIVGTNVDEGTLFIALTYDVLGKAPLTAEQYPMKVAAMAASLTAQLGGNTDTLTRQILAQYPLSNYTSAGQALAAVLGDGTFSCPAATTAQLLSVNTPTYQYEFADRSAPMPLLPAASFPYGAAHTTELQFLFTQDAEKTTLTPDELKLATTMRSYWTRFAATGAPSAPLGPEPFWPATAVLNSNVQGFVAPTPALRRDFANEHHCNFWNQILLQGLLGG